MFSITSPVSNGSVGNTFTASGACSMQGGANHTVSAYLKDGNGNTVATGSTSHTTSTWSATFTNAPSGTYNVVATCGVMAVTATNVKVG